MSQYDERDSLIESLLTKPDSVQLFRGQKTDAEMGLHYTPDETWARNFGPIILKMTLPANAKIKLITSEDTEQGIKEGIYDEEIFWQTFFNDGYDAIIGTDSHNSMVLDVIVNPEISRRLRHR
ncbi:MAG: hypothetical protein Q8P01_03495 [bacterium]|nr:hypothetical protein [bacterium]